MKANLYSREYHLRAVNPDGDNLSKYNFNELLNNLTQDIKQEIF